MQGISNIKSGIYKITNLINGKFYVGSAINLSMRRSMHEKELKENKHHNIKLQNSFNKYGDDNFLFEIIELVNSKEDLVKREQYYFDTLKPEFNICRIAGNNLGVKMRDEVKKRLSISKMGEKNPMYGKATAMKGAKHTLEARQLIKEKRKLQIITDETKRKMSAWHKGRKKTAIHQERLNTARRGRSPRKVTCIFCGTEISFLLINKYHNNNCKMNPSISLEERNKTLRGYFCKIRKRVLQLDINNKEVKVWESISDAKKVLKINNIAAVCKGRLETSGGFKWKYL